MHSEFAGTLLGFDDYVSKYISYRRFTVYEIERELTCYRHGLGGRD